MDYMRHITPQQQKLKILSFASEAPLPSNPPQSAYGLLRCRTLRGSAPRDAPSRLRLLALAPTSSVNIFLIKLLIKLLI